jgi:Flp pilus assembly protein TadG
MATQYVRVEFMKSRIQRLAAKFARSRDGSMSIIFAFSCVVLIGMIGVAVDTSRFFNYQAEMQQALDAAALAGAKMLPDDTLTDVDIRNRVNAFFYQTMANAGVKARTLEAPFITIDRGNNSVEVAGKAYLPMTFSRLIVPSDSVTLNRSSKVVFDMKKIELSMVLDITGSMNTNNKLADMKVAAKDIIDELYSGSLSEDGVRIAIAPYSASVNAGDLAAAVTAPTPANNCPTKPKKGQVCQDATGVAIDTCVIERQGLNAATDAAPVGINVLPTVPSLPYGNYFCPNATVVPLSGKSDQDALKLILDGYVAGGATAGHIGTAWGWYLLSPDWSGVLGAGAPKPYGDATVDKSMIIMTDGIFNTSYLTGGATDAVTMGNESYAQFDALCSGIKGKNITVFTVAFGTGVDARAEAELAKCASEPANFFDAKTGGDLKNAFKVIAKKLNTLRVAG